MENAHAALVVIDVQNASFALKPAHLANLMLARIAGLIAQAREAGLPVIYVQHDEPGSEYEAGSDSWRFPAAITPQPGDFINPKHNSSAFHHTELQARLDSQGIHTLYLCGYATDFCLDSTVRQAVSLDYDVVVIEDAHTTGDKPHLPAAKIIEHHNFVWRQMGNIRLVLSDQLSWGRLH